MAFPINDPLIDEKNRVQKESLAEANGDLKEYSRIIRREAEKLKKQNKGKFQKVFNPGAIKE